MFSKLEPYREKFMDAKSQPQAALVQVAARLIGDAHALALRCRD